MENKKSNQKRNAVIKYSPYQISNILGINSYDRVVLLKKFKGQEYTKKQWENKLGR